MLASSHQLRVEVTGSQYPGWFVRPYGIEGSQAGMLGDRFEGTEGVRGVMELHQAAMTKWFIFFRWDAEPCPAIAKPSVFLILLVKLFSVSEFRRGYVHFLFSFGLVIAEPA